MTKNIENLQKESEDLTKMAMENTPVGGGKMSATMSNSIYAKLGWKFGICKFATQSAKG